ncbi:MAG: hypothetical protein NDJ24_04565 [Alphaproteobacteria bacterium]|nr:hypothetical protein [Alphaproteobacteria bacterium]
MPNSNAIPAYPSKFRMLISAFNTAMGGKPLVLTSTPVREMHRFLHTEIAQVAVPECLVDPVHSQWRLLAKMPEPDVYWAAARSYSYDEIIDVLTEREIAAARQRGIEGDNHEIVEKLQETGLSATNVLNFVRDPARALSVTPLKP